MTTKTTPTVGDTVHYTDHINHAGGHVRCFDAEVTSVNPDGTIDIDEALLGGRDINPAYSIREGKPGDLYTWHWPEPSEGEPYPYPEGDVIVLGPETFKAADGSVISHKGENYYPTSVVISSSEVGGEEPSEGERETNRLLHHITGGDFL